MATADTSIYSQVGRTSRIQSPYEQQNQLSAVLQGVNQNRMAEMQMRKAQSDEAKQNRLSALLSAEYAAPEQRESALMRSGFAGEAQDMTKNRLEASKTQATTQKTLADAEKQKLATAIEKIGAVGQLLGGVRDQGSYDQARAQAQAMGLDVSSMPPQFDPALVEQKRAQSLNMEQQLAQVWKQKGFDMDVRKQGEVERNNQTQNRISQGQLGVAQGNLGLRRQELDQARTAPRGQFLETQDGYVLGDPRTGQVQPVIGASGQQLRGKTGDKPLTEGQAKAVAFASRMENSDRLIGDLAKQGVNVSVPGSRMPVIGDAISAMQPGERQRLDQAKRDFINAVLRRESGAVISDAEFANAERQYFPQIGEGKEEIAQKARARRVSIEGMRADVPQSSQAKVDEISGTGSGPKQGQVVDGYRFKGGNPADPKSWEKQ